MAENENGAEKTEKPTQKRLDKAAKDGDVLQSKELATALVMMAGIIWLAMAGPEMVRALGRVLAQGLRFDRQEIVDFQPAGRFMTLISDLAVPVGGVFAIAILAAIAAPAMLGSIGFRPSVFAFKPEKMNPISGMKRILGPQGLIELVKSLGKVLLMGSIGVWLIWHQLAKITDMGKTGVQPAVAEIGDIFIMACLVMGGALFVIAGFDIPMQIMRRSSRLNMTKQEIREEHKESEGSPELKGHIRRRQFEMLSGSARKAVEEATVILTNPTHFSVALRYKPGVDAAPVVVARGRGATAAAIRELAEERSVPMLQYPELTRALYYTTRAGQVIDERLFVAVATILAFVFRIENRMATEMDRPHIDLPGDLRFDSEGRRAN